MNRLKQLKTHPFGLLLCLEWMLLTIAIFGELPSELFWDDYGRQSELIPSFPILPILGLLVFGLMGLRLPKNNPFNKWLYLFLELGAIWLPVILGQQIFPFATSYLVVVIRNRLIFQSKQCWLANGLVFLAFAPSTMISFEEDLQILQSELSKFQTVSLVELKAMIAALTTGYLILFALVLAFVFMLVNALLGEYQSRQKLAIAHEQLRQYAMLVEDRAILHERNRIAREIHDLVGHALTAQTIQLNNAIAFWQIEPNKAYQFLTEAKELVTTALKEIRHSVSTLRADPLEGKSLKDVLDFLIQEFSYRTKIIPLYTNYLSLSLSKEVKLTIYRIVQEALTNIAKHSKATEVIVNIQAFSKYLQLTIKDNGKGFNPKQNTTGFGLQGIRERVTALGGNIEIVSEINCGCNIIITIPHKTLLLIDN